MTPTPTHAALIAGAVTALTEPVQKYQQAIDAIKKMKGQK